MPGQWSTPPRRPVKPAEITHRNRGSPLLARETTPSAIVRYLDQYVIGQEDAKKVLAVAVYSHYRKIATFHGDRESIAKSNILLVGPSGTGKTLLCDTLSRMLKVPFVTADATSLAQTKYVNEEIEAVLLRLLDKADGNIEDAQHGIIFIDEIDKLKTSNAQARAISGESVQHALLKIMEGSPVKLKDNCYIDTSNILFICGGAFVGLENIMSKTHGFGFIATSGDDNQNILDRLNKRVKPTDLFEFGLIPEFTGRLPIIANLHPLTKAMLVSIMSVPRELDLSAIRRDLPRRRRGTEDRPAGLRADCGDSHRIQDGRAQPAWHLRRTDHADSLRRAGQPRHRAGRDYLTVRRCPPCQTSLNADPQRPSPRPESPAPPQPAARVLHARGRRCGSSPSVV
jgi:ATP-dependent Clp protease ATP-binding subunit ClpX